MEHQRHGRGPEPLRTRQVFLLAGLLALTAVLVVACFSFFAPTPTPAPVATPVPTPTPEPTPTPTPVPALTEPIAEQLVHDYIQSLARKDFDHARSLTTGDARTTTDQLVGEFNQQIQDAGVDPNFNVTRLDVGPTELRTGSAIVDSVFAFSSQVQLGPISVPGPTVEGNAKFTVEEMDGTPKIAHVNGQLGPISTQ